MSRAARSVSIFSVYMALVAVTMLARPALLAVPLGLRFDELWVRVAGMLTGILAYYYFEAARGEWTGFIRVTIRGRMAVMVFLVGFAVAGLAGPQILGVGAVDLGAALWTWRCLNLDERAPSASRVAV